MPTNHPDVDERAHRIEAVTDTALARYDLEQLLRELLARVRELLQVDTAVVLLWDENAHELRATASDGLEEAVRQGVRIPIGKGFAGRIAAERRPIVLHRVDASNVVNPLLWERGIKSLLGVPLLAGGVLVGVLHVGTLQPRVFDDDDAHVLQLAADRIALATQAELTAIDRAAATALQRSLLPARLPAIPGFEFAARYVPGSRTGVSGDWYDVFELPHGRWGVVIGDVAGHGLGAATVMGRLRSALRAYAIECDDPAATLDKLSENVRHFETSGMATVGYTIMDPKAGRMWLSSSGHLPPLLALPDGTAEQVPVPIDPPMHAALPQVDRRSTMLDVAPGSVLVWYTDGLVERRGDLIDDGIQRLRTLVTSDSPEAVCARIMANLVGTSIPDDDIAILALRRTP